MPFVDDLTPTDTSPPPPSLPPQEDDYSPFHGNGPVTPTPGPVAWGDYPHAIAAGWHDTLATGAGFLGSVAEPEAQPHWQDEAKLQQWEAQQSHEAMTPGGQAGSIGLSIAEQAPGLAITGLPMIAAGPIAGPAIGAAIMGAQGRGELYNRDIGQGITPTSGELAAATGIGVASGLAMPGVGAVAGKIATGPLARVALGVAGDSGIFGATGAAQEAVGQETEQRGGVRQGYSPGEIASQGLSGAEWGAAFGGLHAFNPSHGGDRPTDTRTTDNNTIQNPVVGGENVIGARSGKGDSRKPEAQTKGLVADPSKPVPVDGGRQPSPVVTPDIEAALGGKPVTPESNAPAAGGITQEQKDASNLKLLGDMLAKETDKGNTASAASIQQQLDKLKADIAARNSAPAPAPTPETPTPETLGPETPAPETPESREAQHAALLDPNNPREAMVYPPGTPPIPLEDKQFGQIKLADGRIVQYDKKGQSKLTQPKIRELDKNGQLNDLLQLGPVNKEEALQRSVAGEPPAVVTERDAAGNELKSAAGTTATAPAQVEALEAAKGDGNTVQVETPEQLLAGREPVQEVSAPAPPAPEPPAPEPVAPEPPVPEVPAVTPESNAAPTNNVPAERGRILEAEQTPEEKAAVEQAAVDQRKRVADNLKALATEKATAAPKGKNWTKGELLKKDRANEQANSIVQQHPPGENELPTDTYRRALSMVEAAKQAKLTIPEEVSAEGRHGPGMLILREAKDLTKKTTPLKSDYARYYDREGLVRTGRYTEALEARRAEGKESAALGSPDEGGEEGVRPGEHTEEMSPEEHLIHSEEEAERGATETEELNKQWDVPDDANHGDILRKIEAAKAIARDQNIGQPERDAAMRAVERLQERMSGPAEGTARPKIEVKEGEHYRMGKAAVGFKTETVKRRNINRLKQELEDRQEGRETERDYETGVDQGEPTAKPVMAFDDDGNPVEVTPKYTFKVPDILREFFDPKKYSPSMRPMLARIVERIEKLASDVDIHFISADDMDKLAGEKTLGYFDGGKDANHIMINLDRMQPDTVFHEAFHAATANAIEAYPALKKLIGRLMDEVRRANPELAETSRGNLSYIFKNEQEFLTGMMTNRYAQKLLKGVKISKELAKDIGIPLWRRMTSWEGMLGIIREALGLHPRDTPAIEAALSLTEQSMWANPRGAGDLMEAQARANNARANSGRANTRQYQKAAASQRKMAPPERDQEAYFRTPSEVVQSVRNIDRDMAKQFTKDKVANLSVRALKGSTKLLSGTWLNDIHGHLFVDGKGKILEAINHARDKVSNTYNSLRTGDRNTITRGYLLDRKYSSQMGDYAKLINLSSRFDIHADRGQPSVSTARRNVQRDANYAEARRLYNSLPEELQQRYRSEKQYYMNKQQEMADTVLGKVIPMFDPPKGSTVEEVLARAKSNDLTDDDMDHYRNLGVDKIIDRATALMNKKSVYFSAQRNNGNHVVTGRYEMPKGGSEKDYSGELLPDNRREFSTENDVRKYVADTHMPATIREVGYIKDGKGGYSRVYPNTPETQKAGLVGKTIRLADADVTRYQATLERQHTEMHNTYAEALKARAEMEKAGVGDLSGVLDRRDEKSWSSLNSADQKILERRINSRNDLTSSERQHMLEATRQMMLSSQSSMSPHFMQSRKVAGAKFNSAEGLDAYSRAINNHIARNAHSTELNDAMDRLVAHEKANRSDESATRRSIVANEMQDRVYGDANMANSKTSPLLQKLMTLSFINYLVRPSHIFLSQIHPWVYSVPAMGGRHGYWKAAQAQRQAMADLGGQFGNLGRGAKAGVDMFKATREKDTDKAVAMAHGADPIHDMINHLTDKNERDAMLKMYETEHLHSAYDQSMFRGGGLDRANAVMQQFTNAMEANNRLSTALAAYRLEKAAHGDHASSLAYARRMIEETHGLYSQSNIAPIFRNPMVRPLMQFHQQPMNLAIMLYRNIGKAWQGDSEARWTLAYQLATAAAVGGMGGMPMDVPKLAALATEPFTGMGPSDWADKEQRTLSDLIGEGATNVINEGLPGMMGPFGPSLGHRMGFDAGFLNDEPKSGSPKDLMAYLGTLVAGAPGSVIMDYVKGSQALEQGDYQKAAESFLPGSLRDIAKAYRLGTEGETRGGQTIRPGSYGDALLQVLGFSGVERERQMAGHYAAQKALKADTEGKQAIVQSGTQTDIAKWNAAHPLQRITAGELKAARSSGKRILGLKVTPKNQAQLKEYENAYQ